MHFMSSSRKFCNVIHVLNKACASINYKATSAWAMAWYAADYDDYD